MEIKWHGHACFEIRDSMKIVIDPHDGRAIGIKPPRATPDVVLITHHHFDHDAVRVLNGNFKIIDAPGNYVFDGIKIRGILGYHDKEMGARRGKITMYKIELEGVKLLHVGDLGHILSKDMVKEIGDVDILFIPVGGVYTVDAREAFENVKLLQPKIVIPMHYRFDGLTLGIAPVEDFLKYFTKEQIIYVGNSIEFTKEDLENTTKIWVFTL
ncbi:MAG: MBL fold metallo-hydrolase [Thermoplasmata archaeon]|nr:MBL fold metallo-hydrolase [Thermoplasmata archaeon]